MGRAFHNKVLGAMAKAAITPPEPAFLFPTAIQNHRPGASPLAQKRGWIKCGADQMVLTFAGRVARKENKF